MSMKKFITVAQFAYMMGCKRQAIYQRIAKHQINVIKIGHQWVIPEKEFKKWTTTGYPKRSWKLKRTRKFRAREIV